MEVAFFTDSYEPIHDGVASVTARARAHARAPRATPCGSSLPRPSRCRLARRGRGGRHGFAASVRFRCPCIAQVPHGPCSRSAPSRTRTGSGTRTSCTCTLPGADREHGIPDGPTIPPSAGRDVPHEHPRNELERPAASCSSRCSSGSPGGTTSARTTAATSPRPRPSGRHATRSSRARENRSVAGRDVPNGVDVQRFRPGVTVPDWRTRCGPADVAARDVPRPTDGGQGRPPVPRHDRPVARTTDLVRRSSGASVPKRRPSERGIAGDPVLRTRVRYVGPGRGGREGRAARPDRSVRPPLDQRHVERRAPRGDGVRRRRHRPRAGWGRGGRRGRCHGSAGSNVLSPDRLATAVRELVEDSESRRHLAAEGSRWARQHASLESMALRFISLYQMVAEEKRSHGGPFPCLNSTRSAAALAGERFDDFSGAGRSPAPTRSSSPVATGSGTVPSASSTVVTFPSFYAALADPEALFTDGEIRLRWSRPAGPRVGVPRAVLPDRVPSERRGGAVSHPGDGSPRRRYRAGPPAGALRARGAASEEDRSAAGGTRSSRFRGSSERSPRG